MKTALSASIAVALASLVWAGCGSADDPAVGTTGQDLSSVPGGPSPTPLCRPSDCGPPLGLKTILCPDGSVGGNTGRCIPDRSPAATARACHWEIRECPPVPSPSPVPPIKRDCSAAAACKGPAPGVVTKRCPDGSTAGPECVDRDGSCEWEITTCPSPTPPTCGKTSCSSAQTCCVGVPFKEPTCISGKVCPL